MLTWEYLINGISFMSNNYVAFKLNMTLKYSNIDYTMKIIFVSINC